VLTVSPGNLVGEHVSIIPSVVAVLPHDAQAEKAIRGATVTNGNSK
jgi:hypothetical protein